MPFKSLMLSGGFHSRFSVPLFAPRRTTTLGLGFSTIRQLCFCIAGRLGCRNYFDMANDENIPNEGENLDEIAHHLGLDPQEAEILRRMGTPEFNEAAAAAERRLQEGQVAERNRGSASRLSTGRIALNVSTVALLEVHAKEPSTLAITLCSGSRFALRHNGASTDASLAVHELFKHLSRGSSGFVEVPGEFVQIDW